MSYQRTFSSLGCPELSLDGALALAQRHSLPLVELRAVAGGVDVVGYFSKTYGTPAQLAEHLKNSPVRLVSLDTSLHLIGDTDVQREQFLAFLPWAEALGVKWLRVFDGGKTDSDAELAAAAATVHWWRELRAKNNWRADIMIETHDLLFTANAINRFLKLAPRIGILWDTHHTWKRGGENPVDTWHAIKADVVHLHVKDSVSVPSGKHPFSYVLPGDGEFPMAPLREILKQEYHGPISLEWERLWHPHLAPLEEPLRVATERGWW
ncbi:sugar phosphate isomerase/epimerase family protein [Oleiharenicola lentus]|uniref:sugar phosphate isomerase/epimerase family protein n=1 Tax=Oleiharenicola lentus TaxID=2508720 RepID=UPI003F66A090